MGIIACKVMEGAVDFVGFPLYEVAVLLCCIPELPCPMAMISNNNFIAILQVSLSFALACRKILLSLVSFRKYHTSQTLLYFTIMVNHS